MKQFLKRGVKPPKVVQPKRMPRLKKQRENPSDFPLHPLRHLKRKRHGVPQLRKRERQKVARLRRAKRLHLQRALERVLLLQVGTLLKPKLAPPQPLKKHVVPPCVQPLLQLQKRLPLVGRKPRVARKVAQHNAARLTRVVVP